MIGGNVFRLFADQLHLISILLLAWKMHKLKSCAGVSLKTQILYAVVFTCRYLDIFWNFSSMYNYILKLFFLGSSYTIVYQMKTKYKHSYDATHDTFRIEFLIVPTLLLAMFVNYAFTPFEVLWAFSIYLESVAILPQLFLLQRTGECENLTSHYIFALGGYRALYLVNWIYRYYTEPNYSQWIVWVAGVIQTLLYCDFFYYYITANVAGRKIKLPT
eukprot:TRINITY_DN14968_c0_g1::TRINITY_DN14968_c0_g1_i1::g.25803::m.25803 TRINITY_DN14968_c0_g1::TRINITY_DN14968_c0_g1_i1::g.25803  ORF type:complete len:217 (-),score=19.96,sp/Q5XHA2/ERD21_XENTR/57.82/6e-84,ER_lumen_recept/PF00810.13/1.5e-57,PQ-loop/PF04193.9/0.1,PQ-loop/PF04193.9/0.22,PQ-loop/PF04193.9/5.8e+03,ICMT/PF04140.9/1.9e+03,ICMT/PF04140.9/0.047 TRINITY_DN14968_c0_g1_i1:409-1059(-)